MKTKLLGCLAATVIAAASVIATPATAFRGGGGIWWRWLPRWVRWRRFPWRHGHPPSVFVPGGNRIVGAPFAGQHAFVNRRFFDEGRRDRFEDRFRHRRFFANGFDNFAFIGVPFAYGYAAYGNGCWRWDGWQWINICYDYGN